MMVKLTDKEIKDYQLQILDLVHSFCLENNYQYYLQGGSLIGAIRHDGYIPWDDDIDIFIFRKDYYKFIKQFNESFTDYHAYSLESDKGYNLHFCKISYEGTVLIEKELKANDVQLGVNIDLFPLDILPEGINDKLLLKRLHWLNKLFFGKAFMFSSLNNRPLKQRFLILIYKMAALFCSKRMLGEKQEKLAKQFENCESQYCSNITCHMKRSLPYWKISDFTPMEHLFEGRTYYIPSGYDSILRAQFGDYMELPPRDQRVFPHSFEAWKK